MGTNNLFNRLIYYKYVKGSERNFIRKGSSVFVCELKPKLAIEKLY